MGQGVWRELEDHGASWEAPRKGQGTEGWGRERRVWQEASRALGPEGGSREGVRGTGQGSTITLPTSGLGGGWDGGGWGAGPAGHMAHPLPGPSPAGQRGPRPRRKTLEETTSPPSGLPQVPGAPMPGTSFPSYVTSTDPGPPEDVEIRPRREKPPKPGSYRACFP